MKKFKARFLLSFFITCCFASLPASLGFSTALAAGSDEAENIRVYEESFRSVVNIVNSTVRYDNFYRAIPMEDYGAGVVIGSNGLVLTSLHLVEGALRIDVELYNGAVLRAGVVGVDRNTDIALLKVNGAGQRLHPIRFAKGGKPKVGAKVLAIGNPFGLDKSLTVGIVSSVDRRIRSAGGAVIDGLIQTDAATNPGSSGGPLLNGNAEMVGLNSVIFSPVAGSVGVGLAIPVSVLEKGMDRIVERAKESAYAPRVWLGLAGQDIDKELGARMELKGAGILVSAVFEGSPAERAGIKGATGFVNLPLDKGRQLRVATGGDYIVDIDGKSVERMIDFNARVAAKRAGQSVKVGLLRGKSRLEILIPVEPRPRVR